MKEIKRIITTIFFLMFLAIMQGQTDQKKVIMHYMGWFSQGTEGRQWDCGHARTPLIGDYDSHSWATLTYHMLLSWSCGIDGLVINVKDDYDAQTFNMIKSTINWIHGIDSLDFKYSFSISYDDQGLPDVPTAESKFIFLRDSILPKTKSFLTYSGVPVIFLFQYGKLTPAQYKTALSTVFNTNIPKLIRNEIDQNSLVYASSFYSWVQPGNGGVWNGSSWGQDYLTWYYNTLKSSYNTSINFACGGVWAGFNDSINHCWGSDRGINRQNGTVYDTTWSYVINYSGTPPMKFAYLETWNDWNEGTELEPSLDFGYKYLKLTVKNINLFKGTNISADTFKFEVAKNIYSAANFIKTGTVDSNRYFPVLRKAISTYLQSKFDSSKIFSDSIIAIATDIPNKKINYDLNAIDIFPNPAQSLVKINISLTEKSQLILNIIDVNGKLVETLYSGFLPQGNKTFSWNSSSVKKGIYFCSFTINGKSQSKKILLN